MDRELTCLRQGPGATPQCAVDSGQDKALVFTPWGGGGGRLPAIVEFMSVGSLVTRKTIRRAHLSLVL